jgi:nicotinate-nucleotide adenylyltransferase
MRQIKKAIGILGGTFDPIHFGHLRMALELYEALDLSVVNVIPCYRPMHREQPFASPEFRLAMVSLAIKSDEHALFADDREIRRKGPTYTIDTLLEMRAEFSDSPLCLLVGIDAFLGFLSWHRSCEILNYAHIVVAHRPHYKLPEVGELSDLIRKSKQQEISYIHENPAGGILFQPITALEISATDIRKQIAMGRDPRYLLPDNVYDYIKQHDLYRLDNR